MASSSPLPLILDTDIGTDVDDALALAYAVRHPAIELRAVTTVSGDAVKRARIAAKLLALAGRSDIPVAAGIGGPVPAGSRSPWHGHEGDGLVTDDEHLALAPVDGPALIGRAAGGASLAAVGTLANVAAALDRDPSLPARLRRVAVMGGMFAPVRLGERLLGPADEHNLSLDPASALRALAAGLPLLYVPSDITFRTPLATRHLAELRRGDGLCRALGALVDTWSAALARRGRALPAGQVALLHDPLTVAALVDERFISIERMPVAVVHHQDTVRTFVDPVAGTAADVVTDVMAEAFADHWLEVVLGAAG